MNYSKRSHPLEKRLGQTEITPANLLPADDLWKTRSKSVPSSLVHSVKYMIGAEKPVPEILNFISLHS